MKSVGIASAEHNSARKFINDKNFAIFNNIIDITLHNTMRTDSLIDMVLNGNILCVHKIFKIEEAFCLFNTALCKSCALCLFVNNIVAVCIGKLFLGVHLCIKLFNCNLAKCFNKIIGNFIKVG